jgi:hypothetical protein
MKIGLSVSTYWGNGCTNQTPGAQILTDANLGSFLNLGSHFPGTHAIYPEDGLLVYPRLKVLVLMLNGCVHL